MTRAQLERQSKVGVALCSVFGFLAGLKLERMFLRGRTYDRTELWMEATVVAAYLLITIIWTVRVWRNIARLAREQA
jgi:hypothetical protein